MTEPFVRADVRAFLDELAAHPRPVFNDELMKLIRQMTPEQMPPLPDEPVGDLAEIRNVIMPGPGGDIPLRLFDARRERKPGPVVVFYHGGGFVAASIDIHAGLTAEMARQLDLPVISVEYRLAPEHKWPAAPDDAEAAARWIAENGAAFGRQFTHLILCGDSAGGTLTCITALALRDKPAALPVLMQFPIYPRADSSRTYPSMAAFADGYGLESVNMAYYDEAYRPDVHHWRHSPILADLTGLPPTFLVTAALDPLRDEGRAYAAKAIKAGVHVTYREVPGLIHGFVIYRRAIPSAKTETTILLGIARQIIAEALV
jgi:acetyl esterase